MLLLFLFLDLNMSKTKEVIINFGKTYRKQAANSIQCKEVETGEWYKYLGTVFESQLKFDVNTDAIVKRGQQRIYLLR